MCVCILFLNFNKKEDEEDGKEDGNKKQFRTKQLTLGKVHGTQYCHVTCMVIVESDLSMSAQIKNEHNVWASNSSRNLYLLKKKGYMQCFNDRKSH